MMEIFSMRMAPTLGGKLVMIVSMVVYDEDEKTRAVN
jgi:hypothetical protein